MKNIRLNVFETNSSSTHSISISKSSDGVYETLPVKNGKVVLVGGEFGWEWEKYNDAVTKANYAAVFASGNDSLVKMLTDVIKKHTGAKEVQFKFSSDYNSSTETWAYIDHQSGPGEEGAAHEAFKNKNSLKEFIFNPDSWLFTGNDNDIAPPNFYDVGDVKYTHVLNLDGLILKLKSYPSKDELKDFLYELVHGHYLTQYNSGSFYEFDRGYGEEEGLSLSKIDKGILILVKRKPVYDEGDKFLRYDVDTKELKFKITPV